MVLQWTVCFRDFSGFDGLECFNGRLDLGCFRGPGCLECFK